MKAYPSGIFQNYRVNISKKGEMGCQVVICHNATFNVLDKFSAAD